MILGLVGVTIEKVNIPIDRDAYMYPFTVWSYCAEFTINRVERSKLRSRYDIHVHM